jgi:NADPH:quinone reductase-like Zn-dependent oxidoreductase
MQAIVFSHPGEPGDVLELREVAEPRPEPGEVVIEVSARPIHPSDLFFIRGSYRIRPALPQIAGLSGVGTVVSGDQPSEWRSPSSGRSGCPTPSPTMMVPSFR